MTKEEIIIDSLTKTNKFLKDERDSARRKFCEVADTCFWTDLDDLVVMDVLHDMYKEETK